MHIDSYEFGSIVIDGRTYRADLLIWPGRIKADWWRSAGHLLQLPDVAEALAAAPQVLVVGTGESGRMRLDPELVAYLKEKGIDLVAQRTREACRSLNELAGKRHLAAALHLTC
ncbi:MAG: Mth938-like domain-containing protein [Deltaproteobacteria bacterium]|nr:Mth938-like domain-containing protein [Deltaproteobacteria bacterium]